MQELGIGGSFEKTCQSSTPISPKRCSVAIGNSRVEGDESCSARKRQNCGHVTLAHSAGFVDIPV